MAASRATIERALDRPTPSVRCFLLYGADESGSRALAARLATAMGAEAERIDLSPAQLKADPALLADEAASTSLFGGARHIRVEGAGEECLAALDALLTAPVAGNPVVIVGGALKRDGKLVKRAEGDPAALVYASYPPTDAEAGALVMTLAQARGLLMEEDVARRVAGAAGGDRAVIASELDKLALYADADHDRPRPVTDAMLDAIGAESGEAELSVLVDGVTAGDEPMLGRELSRLAAEGQEGIPLIRAVLRRLIPMAAARAEMEAGLGTKAAVERAARFAHFREREAMARDLPRWPAARLARAIERLGETERALKAGGGAGPLLADALFFAMARTARRR